MAGSQSYNKYENNYDYRGAGSEWASILTNTQRNAATSRLDPLGALAQLIASNQGNMASLQGTPMADGGRLREDLAAQNNVLQRAFERLSSAAAPQSEGPKTSSYSGGFGIEKQQAASRAEEMRKVEEQRQAIRFALEQQRARQEIENQRLQNEKFAEGNPYTDIIKSLLGKVMGRF